MGYFTLRQGLIVKRFEHNCHYLSLYIEEEKKNKVSLGFKRLIKIAFKIIAAELFSELVLFNSSIDFELSIPMSR